MSKSNNSQLKKLSKITFSHWIGMAIVDWSMIVAAIVAATINPTWWVIVLAIILVGSRQSALYSLAHDGIHKRICKNRKLNDFLCHYLCCLPLGTTMTATRAGHMSHHYNLKSLQDPEMPLFATFLFKVPASTTRVIVLFIACLLGLGAFYTLYGIRRFTNPDLTVLWRTTAFNLLVIAILLLTEQYTALAIWYVSLVTSFAAFSYIRDWTEHTAVDYAHRFTPNLFYRLLVFPHNIWLHYEHHKYPNIPFYHLVILTEQVMSDRDYPPVTSLPEVFHYLAQATSNKYQ